MCVLAQEILITYLLPTVYSVYSTNKEGPIAGQIMEIYENISFDLSTAKYFSLAWKHV